MRKLSGEGGSTIENKIASFWRKLDSIYYLNYKRIKLAETVDAPFNILRLQRHLPIRVFNHHIFKKLSKIGGWYIYRNTKLKKKPKKKRLLLTFDCDYREDTLALKKILPILQRHDVRASFAVIGRVIERNRNAYKRVYDEGHELMNHTFTHPSHRILSPNRRFDSISGDEQREEIVKCHNAIENLAREGPLSFRSPHFYDNMSEFRILDELGYRYCSSVSTSNSMVGLPYHPARSGLGECSYYVSSVKEEDNFDILMIPVETCPIHPSNLFSTYHAIRDGVGIHQRPGELYDLWIKTLRRAERKNFACIYFDPMDIAKSSETLKEFERMIVFAKGGDWIFTLMRETRWKI